MVKLAILAVLVAALVAESTCQFKIIRPTYRPPPRRPGPIIRTVRDVDTSDYYEQPAIFIYDPNTQAYEEAESQLKAIQEEPQLLNNPDSSNDTDDLTVDPDENRRFARSLDSPSAKRYGSYSPETGPKIYRIAQSPRDVEWFDAREPLSLDEGKTSDPYVQGQFDDVRQDPHLRHVRSLNLPYGVPKGPARLPPLFPVPKPQPHFPIYARNTREVHIPGVKKPSYRDVVIPNWNPNVKTNPWSRIGGRH